MRFFGSKYRKGTARFSVQRFPNPNAKILAYSGNCIKPAMHFGHTLSLIAGATSVLAVSYIAPGAVWYDTSGKKINAHGGGVVQRGDTFYWTGHSAEGELPK
jgi:hypothetical protein